MAGPISVDDTLVLRTAGNPANGVNLTSASFTPPANAVLLLFISADSDASSHLTFSVSDSQALTWTKVQDADFGTVTTTAGHASAWYAVTSSSTSMTVSVQRTVGSGASNRVSFKIYGILGADTSNPIGNSSKGATTADNYTPTVFNSSVNNTWTFAGYTDWSVVGTPSSTDTEDAAVYSGQITAMSLYKATETATSGTSVSVNLNSGGTSPVATWVAVEIRPAGSAPPPCTSPAGEQSELKWISPKLKYCSWGAWYDASHTTGASCAGTTSGTIDYAGGILSFCNGTNWIGTKGVVGGSCAGTSPGHFEFSNSKYRFCDGTNWNQMGPSNIRYEQSVQNNTTTNSNNINSTDLPNPVNSKSLLLCWVFYNNATPSVSSVSDSKGNSYSKILGPITGTGGLASWRHELWYAANVTGGSGLNVTATFGSTFNNTKAISCYEYTGAAYSSPIDQSASATGSSANGSAGNLTTTSDNQRIFAVMIAVSPPITAGSGFSALPAPFGDLAQEKAAPTIGSYGTTFTNSAGNNWSVIAISIKGQ